MIGTYLVKLSENQLSDHHSAEAGKLLKVIGDLERISDHAVDLLESTEEMREKSIVFSKAAKDELINIFAAVDEILDLTFMCFAENNLTAATTVEPLEQVIDKIKGNMRNSHIERLQQGFCSMETGFIWSDVLTGLERTSDHCSNIAGCVIDADSINLNLHATLSTAKKESAYFKEQYKLFAKKYIPN